MKLKVIIARTGRGEMRLKVIIARTGRGEMKLKVIIVRTGRSEMKHITGLGESLCTHCSTSSRNNG